MAKPKAPRGPVRNHVIRHRVSTRQTVRLPTEEEIAARLDLLERIETWMTAQQKAVMALRWGLCGIEWSAVETAHELGISRQTVQYQEELVVERLRQLMAIEGMAHPPERYATMAEDAIST